MIRILLIAPFPELVEPFKKVFAEHASAGPLAEYSNEEYELSTMVATGVSEMKSLKFDAEVIVSRGLLAMELRRLNFFIPVVEVPVGSIDLLHALHRVWKENASERVAVIGPLSSVMGVERLLGIIPLQVETFVFDTREEIRVTVEKAAAAGVSIVIGGISACKYAREFGLKTSILESGREAMWHCITEAKRLAYMVRQERERMEHFSGLVAGVAHEVNTPLGVSVSASSHAKRLLESVKAGYADGTMDETSFFSGIDGSIESLEIIGLNLDKAVEFMRTFKRIAADQAVEDRREIDLGEYLGEIILSLRPKLKRTPHSVEIDCPDNLKVELNPGALYQIITNFIVNSLSHAYDEGVAGRIRITARRILGGVQLKYRDDGKGIAPEVLERIFEPFFTTARERGGSGLGLYIARNIARKLGGDITCTSRPGKGVEFTVTLPIGGTGGENAGRD